MNTTIFILIMMGYHGSIQTQEFSSRENCVSARNAVISMLNDTYSGRPQAVCVPK